MQRMAVTTVWIWCLQLDHSTLLHSEGLIPSFLQPGMFFPKLHSFSAPRFFSSLQNNLTVLKTMPEEWKFLCWQEMFKCLPPRERLSAKQWVGARAGLWHQGQLETGHQWYIQGLMLRPIPTFLFYDADNGTECTLSCSADMWHSKPEQARSWATCSGWPFFSRVLGLDDLQRYLLHVTECVSWNRTYAKKRCKAVWQRVELTT